MAWPVAKLGDVCQTGSGGTPLRSNKDYYEGGSIPWLMSGEVGQGEIHSVRQCITQLGLANSAAKIFPKETVVIAMYGATAGQVGLLKCESATNQAVCGILPNSRFNAKFLYYYFLSRQTHMIAQATGNAQPNISQVKIKNIDVPLAPLPEQRRIVSILDEAFAGLEAMRANAEKNLQNARDLSASYSDSVFSEQTSWTEANLDEVVAADCSLSYGIVQPGNEVPDGLPIVRPTDLVSRTIELDGLKRINPALAASYQRTMLQAGDLLLCVRGTTGTVAVASKSLTGANVTRGIVPIRFDPKKVLADFGYHLLRCDYVQTQIRAKTYGAALMQINIKDLREVRVRFPKLSEQKSISKRLDAADQHSNELLEIYSAKLAAIDELKQSILQKAFAGELTAAAAVAA